MKTVEPLLTFFFTSRTFFTGIFFPEILRGSLPDLVVGDTERNLIWCEQYCGVIDKPLLILGIENAQTFSGRVMGKIEIGCVLDSQYGLVALQSFLSGGLVRVYNILVFDFAVVKETIGSLDDTPVATSLGDGLSRVFRENFSNAGKSFGEALVAELSATEFFLGPCFSLIQTQTRLSQKENVGVGK